MITTQVDMASYARAYTEVYANNLQPSAEQGTMHLTLPISKDFKSFFSYPAEG